MRILLPLAATVLLACSFSPSSDATNPTGPTSGDDSGASADGAGGVDAGATHGDSGPKADTGTTPAEAGAKDSSAPADTGSPDTGFQAPETGAPETGPPSCTAATCPAAAGSYGGAYSMDTTEKAGTTIVNEVLCTGTNTVTIDLSQSPMLSGTVACHYSGGLVAFDKDETGTIAATVMPDGTVTGQLVHVFGSGMTHTSPFSGTLAAGTISVAGKSSWYPNTQSAVPWDIVFSFTSNKK